MYQLTLKHYFHPFMQSKTALKTVLPSVLRANNSKRNTTWLSHFSDSYSLLEYDQQGNIMDPYQLLPPLNNESNASLNEGTLAMDAYDELLFRIHPEEEVKKLKYQKALLDYCKLDTLAMVIIWEHWKSSI